MTKPNKYAGMIEEARKGAEAGTEAPTVVPIPEKDTPPALPREAASKGPGRPRGKRSDPNYTQVCGYIETATYKRVRTILFNREPQEEFSDLMGLLLADWLAKQEAR